MLGICIVTYNRLTALTNCIDSVQEFTASPYLFAVASDSEADLTTDYCRSKSIECWYGKHRGFAFNMNRALYGLFERGCDPVITLEDDVFPIQYGWEEQWTKAAEIWGHVNYCKTPLVGLGTPSIPFRCHHFSTYVTSTSSDALSKVGYHDPRFYDEDYSVSHAEWTFRFEKFFNWQKLGGCSTVPSLRSGVRPYNFGTSYNGEHLQASHEILASISKEENLFRLPWRCAIDEVQIKNDTNRSVNDIYHI